jgi:hypothetical protein
MYPIGWRDTKKVITYRVHFCIIGKKKSVLQKKIEQLDVMGTGCCVPRDLEE